jgi:aminomethyltransferase
MSDTPLLRTPLYDAHINLSARMVPFAGYEMPVQYPTGVLAEHLWTREHAGLFDVSHMGQCIIAAETFDQASQALEKIVPADVMGLAPQQQRYAQLLAEDGGILDDLMISRLAQPGRVYVVVNASRKEADFAHIAAHLPADVRLERNDDAALIAVQGPEAAEALARLNPKTAALKFMHFDTFDLGDCKGAQVSRSGYTGEDGFEISVPAADALALWQGLLEHPNVKPIGLGARDSLRLEAGLCLYGHDIDETTSPVEADLLWSIGKRRRADGGFIGAERVLKEIADGPSRKRVGIKPDGRAPAREGTDIQDMSGRVIGKITSGGFGPSVNGPVAMGYVERESSVPGTSVQLIVRGQVMPATVVKLPFVAARFKR